MNRILRNALALAALSAATPALAWTTWPDIDFEWYASVGKSIAPAEEAYPAPRPGFIWSPAHWERRDTGPAWVAGHWIEDDYAAQVAEYSGRTPPPPIALQGR